MPSTLEATENGDSISDFSKPKPFCNIRKFKLQYNSDMAFNQL